MYITVKYYTELPDAGLFKQNEGNVQEFCY